MSVERTLSIIKPDAVGKNVIGQIISRFEAAGLTVVAAKMLHLSDAVAGGFYAEHKERPFYPDLVAFMTSGPVIVQVLEGEGAIALNRELMPTPCTDRIRPLPLSVRLLTSLLPVRSAHAERQRAVMR